MLKIEHLSKSYGNNFILDDISVNLDSGIYGLLGANGAGKSTFMKIICGIVKPTKGNIMYNGKNISKDREYLLKYLGYLPQDFSYYPEFTASDFLSYIGTLKGMNNSTVKSESDRLLKLVGLEKVSKDKIKTFSGGMKQRLGIAQTLLDDPKVVILDEPTVGLDPKERIRFRNLLSSLSNDKIIILSTHIVGDLDAVANEILILKDGGIRDQATPIEFLKKIEDKVWEVELDLEESEILKYDFTISNQKMLGHNVLLRIVSDAQPHGKACNVSPNLEDLYLYYFPNKGENL